MTRQREPDEHLDLRGVRCPANSARALVRLECMDAGQLLEILVDDGEPIAHVPEALDEEGHRILVQERAEAAWRLLVEVGG